MKSKYVLCDFKCGKHESCARYCPTMNRQKTTHIGKLPPGADKGKCTLFEPIEADEPLSILNNLNASTQTEFPHL